ncbi:MAG: hypothetical protein COB36_00645 [Alphaproteobacteria bacterium]|nr:MAG: hypothetical protein COB36_00645 [Alphaproteobacteria bacterium]
MDVYLNNKSVKSFIGMLLFSVLIVLFSSNAFAQERPLKETYKRMADLCRKEGNNKGPAASHCVRVCSKLAETGDKPKKNKRISPCYKEYKIALANTPVWPERPKEERIARMLDNAKFCEEHPDTRGRSNRCIKSCNHAVLSLKGEVKYNFTMENRCEGLRRYLVKLMENNKANEAKNAN